MQLQHYKYTRITIDAEICFGKPVVRSTRMPVSSLLDYLSSGMTAEELIKQFPFIEQADISEALAFSASMMQDSFIPLKRSA
ncbi:MAG TPA: DUF433 domain-containing protein, partial [Bacteroidia bacterium]|nr:DUF433 domain-containing protein [Bacteroidia bacterium]